MPKDIADQEEIDLVAATLTGDVRDALLNQIRGLQKPYAQCTYDEQSEVIAHATKVADNLVARAVGLIAAEGRKALTGQLIKIQLKDSIQCQVNFSKADELRHELFDAQGMAVLLVIADMAPFVGEQAPAKAIADQSVIALHLAKDGESSEE